MACCKVPIKINGFSGGCRAVRDETGDHITLSAITNTNIVGNDTVNRLSHLAYLGLKCVNIACPPILGLRDTLGELADFLDDNLSQINTYRSVTLGDLTTDATTAVKAGIASLIAGCGTCCS